MYSIVSRFSLIVFILTVFSALGFTQSIINRVDEPVLLKGADLSSFHAVALSDIVAFKVDAGAWIQIPVQIDEMAVLDIISPYGPLAVLLGISPPSGYNILMYTDASSYVGADPVLGFDADDELVFMAGDAGEKFIGSSFPAGVIDSTAREITVYDSLSNEYAYVYLFRKNGTLDPSAGVDYVNYNFSLNSGSYPGNYNLLNGPNPETTVISNSQYELKFLDRWILDDLKIFSGSSSGNDILDRQQFFFAPGNCVRTENTFASGEGCFIANIDGPVRAIRSLMGANSGPLTQQTIFAYRSRVDIEVDVRVHSISGLYDVLDYETSASGMTYYNNNNTQGLTIDGAPESFTVGPLTWELTEGPHGSLISFFGRNSNIAIGAEASLTSFREDQIINSINDCTGDGQAYGSHGWAILFDSLQSICTDPLFGTCSFSSSNFRLMKGVRRMKFDSPGADISDAQLFSMQMQHPLITYADSQAVKLACPIVLSYSKFNVSCNGLSNGAATVFVGGDYPPFSFLWSTGSTSNSVNTLAGGNYSVTVTDDQSCEKQIEISVFEPSPLTVFGIVNNPGQGDINLLVGGGVAPYTYSWSNGATTEDVFGLRPGIYFVSVSDKNGCAKVYLATVN